jgi:hypothetical protein
MRRPHLSSHRQHPASELAVSARAAALVVALTAVLLVPAPASAQTVLPPGGTFWDDDGSTHEGMIEAIVAAGITTGCSSDGRNFCPSAAVTRGQMATFLARALGLPPADRDYFSDDAGNRHENAINQIAAAGIASGTGGETFQPEMSVTRAQMATFLSNALDLPPYDGANRFTDVAGIHTANVNRVAEAGITAGCNSAGTNFCPSANVLRGQMASFVGRGVGLTATIPPPRALTEGVATVKRYMDAVVKGTYSDGQKQSVGIARKYLDYLVLYTRNEGTFDDQDFYRITTANTTATSLGDRRWRLNMVVRWEIPLDGDSDIRELRSFVVVQRSDGTFRLESYRRNGLPMTAYVRTGSIASSASGKTATAKLVAQFRRADDSRPLIVNVLEVKNNGSQTLTIDNVFATYTTRSDGRVYFQAEDFGPPPSVRPGQTIEIVLTAEDVRSPQSAADIRFDAWRDGFNQTVTVRVPEWPR